MYSPSLYIMLANAHEQELRRAAQTATYTRAAAGSNDRIRSTAAHRALRRFWASDGTSASSAYAPTECCPDAAVG